MTVNIHATCISLQNKGILFIGSSGAGKSDLALRLITRYKAELVADDRVDITVQNKEIIASSPDILQGLLEVRGIGIVRYPFVSKAKICAVFDLISDNPERMPEPQFYEIEGINLPLFKINPFELSSPEKVLSALSLL